MPLLHPFLLVPEFHERVWGARDLRPVYTRIVGPQPIGEAWLTGEACKIAQGPWAGQTLGDLARLHGPALTGTVACPHDRFPLLIKFLFPKERLSVQVHPDDAQARAVGQACGKTECWYVVAAEPGAKVGLGLKPGVTRADLARAIQENRAEHLLNWIDVAPRDMIYVDAGTVHAIGGGAIIIETQQNSDTTYRLYDYGRPRELHVEAGLAATKETTAAGKARRSGKTVLASPYFVVEQYTGAQPIQFAAPDGTTMQILVLISGTAMLECGGIEPISFTPGEAVVVPAAGDAVRVTPQWECELLRMTLPEGTMPEPETTKPW